MRVNANAVLRSWTLLAAFGGSYAPDIINVIIVLIFQSMISAQFELEVAVQSFEDPVDDCGDGFDICALYVDRFCLSRQSEDPETCSLSRRTGDLDFDDLPKTVTLSSPQPWPVGCTEKSINVNLQFICVISKQWHSLHCSKLNQCLMASQLALV